MDLDKIRAEIQEDLRRNPPDAPEDKELEALLSERAAIWPEEPDPDVIDLLTADDPPVPLPPGWEERRAARIKRAAAIGWDESRAARVTAEIGRLRAKSGPLGELIELCRMQSNISLVEVALMLGTTPPRLQNLAEIRDPRFFMGYPPARVARLVDEIGCPRTEFASFARRALAQAEPVAAAAAPVVLKSGEREAEPQHAPDGAALDAWLNDFLSA